MTWIASEIAGSSRPCARSASMSACVHLGREVRQLDGEVAERALTRREVGLAVVVRRVSCGLVVCALGTEVVGVCLRSVVAALLGRRDRREELTLLS